MKKQSRQSINKLKGYLTSIKRVRTIGDRKEQKFKTNRVKSHRHSS